MTYILDIESLDLEGRGVGHHEGKVVFVDGVLPGERAEVKTVRAKTSYDKASVVKLLTHSAQRVEPPVLIQSMWWVRHAALAAQRAGGCKATCS